MKNSKYIVLGLLLSIGLHIQARVFESGDVLYIKTNPVNWNWYGNNPGDGKFAYFYNSNTLVSAWSEELIGVPYCGDVLQVKVPAGDWTHVVMTRNSVHSGPNWSNVHGNGDDNNVNKSADIEIPANQNYLDNFRQYKDKDSHGGDMWHWEDCYFFRPSVDPSSVTAIDQATKELVEVCMQSAGDPLSLQPRLISSTEGYDYNQARTWFKWDGSQWKELAKANGSWGFDEPEEGLNETIGAAYSHTYYFLSTAEHSKQRFIEIAVTKDCSPSCEITDFGVVTSNVNIHDSTYVLDGIVAFKDATGKTLRISVTDEKGEHHVDYNSPTTPLIFSLSGLFANGASGITATASFIGTEYSRISESFSAPDAIYSTPNISNISKTHGEATSINPEVFNPQLDGADGFKWHDNNTTDHVRNITAYNFDTTIIYTYYEYEKASEVSGNLIINGDFSSPTFDYGAVNYDADVSTLPHSTISQYHYWGKDVTSAHNFYTLKGNISGGMAIVQDANAFWRRFTKKIEKKSGTHFALFDADNSGSKNAWVIETGTTQPNLKLAKGTNYMFSFWVANINNYGEMNNAAKLQFEISYSLDGGSSWSTPEQLGNPIDLNDYLDNLWHQNSYVYTAQVDASNVRISVRDLNTNSNPGGNDFALDDIKFQPISVVSQAIKYWHRFVVKIFEDPVIVEKPQITITKTPACGDTDFEMQVKVDYSTLNNKYPVQLQLTDDIYGDLFTTPIAIDPAVNPNSITITLPTATYGMLVADGAVHTLTATIIREDGKHNNKGGSNSNTYISPGVPAMVTPVLAELNKVDDKTTFDLEIVTQYNAFKGTRLHYEWDGAEWTDVTIHSLSYKESTLQTVKDTLRNLVADGKSHTLRVYSDNTLDCEYTFMSNVPAPYMPSVTVSTLEIQTYSCVDDTYSVKVTASFTNSQMHDIIFKDWKTGDEKHVATTTDAGTADYVFTYAWDAVPSSHEYNVYFDGASASEHKKSYTSPAQPALDADYSFTATGCNITTYTLQLDLIYTNQRGTMFYASVDGGTPVAIANLNTGAQEEKKDVTLTIAGLTADGKEHSYSVWTDDTKDCSLIDIAYTAPYGPQITSANVAVLPYACDDANFQVKVEVDFANGQGHNLIIEDWKGNQQIIPTDIIDTKKDYTFSYTWEAPTTHEYKAYFEGNELCKESHKPSFDVPFLPVIDKVEITGVPTDLLACSTTNYIINVVVTTHFDTSGRTIRVEYDENGTAKTIDASATGTVTTIPLVLTNMDDATQTVTVYIIDALSCPVSTSYTPPTLARITPNFDVIVSETACGVLNYTISGTVSFDMIDGDLIVEYDAAHRAIITPSSSSHSANFTIPGMTAAGTGLKLNAWFSGSNTAACTVMSKPFDAPVVPSMAIKNVTQDAADCDLTSGVSFDVDYTFQQGDLKFWVDNNSDSARTITPKNASALNTGTLRYAGFNADGKEHMLHVQFNGANSCEDSVAFLAPLSQVISSVAVSGVPTTILCDATGYTANVVVTMPYDATGKNIVLMYEGKDTTVAVSGNPTIVTLPLTTADTTGLTVKARFSEAPASCETVSDAYAAPTRLTCIKDPVTVCKGESYTWPVTGLTYGPFMTVGIDTIASTINTHDSLFVTVHPQPEISLTPIDTLYAAITEIRLPYVVTEGTPNTFVISLAGSSTTQARSTVDTLVFSKPAGVTTGDYTVSVQAVDSNFSVCNTGTSLTIHIAGIPTVSDLTVTPSEVECDATSYDVEVHMAYSNPRGNIVLEDKTSGTIYSYPVPSVAYNTTQILDTIITMAAMTPAVHNWEAYFIGWTSASATSVAPTVPSMRINNVTCDTADCNLTTGVSFDVDYTYQQGDLHYWVDNMAYHSMAITPKDASALNSDTLYFSGFNADGKEHTLHVQFNGANSCEDSVTFLAPLSQVISSVVVSGIPDSILCNATSYTANVAVNMPFDATGKSIRLYYEGTSITIPATGTTTTTTLTMTYADTTGFTVRAAYADALATCVVVSAPYDAPTRWSCERDYKDICLGESYTWHNTSYCPTSAGVFGYNDHYDSLYLHVHAEPRVTMQESEMICDDTNEIRLPYAVADGTPNLFDVTIKGQSFSQAKGSTDTIIISRPASIPAGSYTALITVRDSMVSCYSTTQTSFTIALSDHVYSKWTDVLFVDNSDHRFLAYQWFADGVAMGGETKQHLYASQGLSGSDILYYCQLTTTDGETLYTCPQTFDEVTPSRTQTGDGAAQIIGIYDTMGRLVTGTPVRGIYIIVSEKDGERVTTKTIIYE